METKVIVEYVVIGIGLIALLPAWQLLQSIYFQSRWSIVAILFAIIFAVPLAAAAFYFPFMASKNQEVDSYATLVDMLLMGGLPLAALSLILWVLDRTSERPKSSLLVISAAACLAIPALPILYYFYSDKIHEEMSIVIKSESGDAGGTATPASSLLNDASAKEVNESATDGSSIESGSEEADAANSLNGDSTSFGTLP